VGVVERGLFLKMATPTLIADEQVYENRGREATVAL
jgi:ribose 5-phosphate isomerase